MTIIVVRITLNRPLSPERRAVAASGGSGLKSLLSACAVSRVAKRNYIATCICGRPRLQNCVDAGCAVSCRASVMICQNHPINVALRHILAGVTCCTLDVWRCLSDTFGGCLSGDGLHLS